MFGLTKREQRWAADQKAAEVFLPFLSTIVEAKMKLTESEHIARLERELAALKADIERYVRIASDQEAKLAALEAQEPVAASREAMRKECLAIIDQVDDGETSTYWHWHCQDKIKGLP